MSKPLGNAAGRRRRGTAYVIVLGTSLLVGVMALGALQVTRARGRFAAETSDAAIARQCALDGVEIAKLWMRQDPDWRSNRPAGVWVTDFATGQGTVTIAVSDPVDGNVGVGQHDAVDLKVTGKKGAARAIYSVRLQAVPIPLPVLAFSAHSHGQFHVFGGKTLKSAGSVISSNTQLRNDGTIFGGVDVAAAAPLGSVLELPRNTNAAVKANPSIAIAEKYAALGRLISPPTTIQNAVLAPGYNSLGGGTNADGVYVIRPSSDLTIKNSRIHGTLVVITTKKVKIEESVLIHPFRADYPTLIVTHDVEFQVKSQNPLSEVATLTNFNPPGAPYNGVSDILPVNTYPSEIQGLVHVGGTASLKEKTLIRGCLLCNKSGNDAIKIEDTPEFIHTPSLFSNPPQWYTEEVRMPIVSGSWRQPAN